MTDKVVKNQVYGGVINPVMAVVAGAAVASVAVAGAMIMSNKNNQDKVKNIVSNVKDNLNKKKRRLLVKQIS